MKRVTITLVGAMALAGCAGQTSAPPTGEALVETWVEAVNAEDWDAAMALMADEVSGLGVPLEGADEIRGHMEENYTCTAEIRSIEPVENDFLVDLYLTHRAESEACPAEFVDAVTTFVFKTEEGLLTYVP